MELLIPGYLVLLAAGIGGFIAVSFFMWLFIKLYLQIDHAQFSYMAQQLHAVRHRNRDWENVDINEDHIPPTGFKRAVFVLMDLVFGGVDPDRKGD